MIIIAQARRRTRWGNLGRRSRAFPAPPNLPHPSFPPLSSSLLPPPAHRLANARPHVSPLPHPSTHRTSSHNPNPHHLPQAQAQPQRHRSNASPPRSANRSPTKRRPTTLTAGADTFVAADARLEGTIVMGAGCVVHPRASILVASGEVYFGDGCVVEENAEVLFRGPGRATVGGGSVVMVGAIVDLVPDQPGEGEGEGGGQSVGEWCSFAPRSRCIGVRVGRQCTIGAGTAVSPSHSIFGASNSSASGSARASPVKEGGDIGGDAGDTTMASPPPSSPSKRRDPAPRLPDRTVIYGSASAARTWDGSGEMQEREVRVNATAFLREILPK